MHLRNTIYYHSRGPFKKFVNSLEFVLCRYISASPTPPSPAHSPYFSLATRPYINPEHTIESKQMDGL